MAATVEEADAAAPAYTVFYHGFGSGRAQVADLMLVDAQQPWQRKGKAEMMELSKSVFAVPAVYQHSTGIMMGQTTAQCAWLGQELGYAPRDGLQFYALKIACDIADMWSESYSKRQGIKLSPEASEHAQTMWLNDRFQKFVKVIEATRVEAAALKIDEDIAGWTYLLGPEPCYIDFALVNMFLTHGYMFGKPLTDQAIASTECPGVIGAYNAMIERPLVKAYLETSEPELYHSVSAAAIGL
mmetsp:Transcript_100951/g.289808  ORF Transcript_100951/g.289808 Transcript_100951/m.289808 type:complete len:242 (-) Transcript_100951:1356-2081(-)|eukprot:CAMPEP_0119466142 /NCGR_PEP_ID=MMETSP1344-20130328/938_1 /TAXON_ID=236787 /ORGANISM="Florenciella parvula, Strain CCMP2471" /LENGTH=241 /DNA_ID=CAMNT_0007498439 /DNA_START=278 /DNA_END=1003 /DNA_ORIENTATION=-